MGSRPSGAVGESQPQGEGLNGKEVEKKGVETGLNSRNSKKKSFEPNVDGKLKAGDKRAG